MHPHLVRHPAIFPCLYGAAVGLLAAFFFGSLGDHLLDTHDGETFRDNAAIDRDFAFFFSAEKEQAVGRFTGEFAKWLISLVADEDPGLFHLTNVAVHALVSFVLFFAYRSTGFNPVTSALGGLLFLVNVAHFQAVHWITQLDYLLGMLCALLALLAFDRFLAGGGRPWLASALLCALLALGAHAGLCALFPLACYWAIRRHFTVRQVMRWLFAGGLASVGLVAFILGRTARDAPAWDVVRTLDSVGLLGIAGQSLEHFGLLLSRLLTTAHWLLVPLYEPRPWEPYLGLALGLGLLWAFRQRIPGIELWSAWTILTLIPFSPIVGLFQSPTDPSRYLYFASAGSSLLLALLLERLIHLLPDRLRLGWTTIATVFFALLAAASYTALKQAETLSIYASARYYIANGDMDSGLERLRTAHARDTAAVPLADTYQLLSLAALTRPNQALPLINQGLALFPNSQVLNIYKLVFTSVTADSTSRHEASSRIAGIANSNNNETIARGYHNLGNGLSQQSETIAAATAYRLALLYHPTRSSTLKALSKSLFQQGRIQESVSPLEQLVKNDSTDYEIVYVLGKLYAILGQHTQANRAFRAVQRLAPDSKEAAKARQALR